MSSTNTNLSFHFRLRLERKKNDRSIHKERIPGARFIFHGTTSQHFCALHKFWLLYSVVFPLRISLFRGTPAEAAAVAAAAAAEAATYDYQCFRQKEENKHCKPKIWAAHLIFRSLFFPIPCCCPHWWKDGKCQHVSNDLKSIQTRPHSSSAVLRLPYDSNSSSSSSSNGSRKRYI